MKRIFSGVKSPKIHTTEKFSTGEPIPQTIVTTDNSLSSPTDDEKVSPELVPIMTLLSAHLHRRYHEGVLLVLEDLKNDGSTGKRQWKEMYAVLIGTQLALWDANELNGDDVASLRNSASKPTYINFTDANIQSIETVKGVTAENDKKLENILVVSTTLKNRYFLQFSNNDALNQWNAAIRLSLYECTSLQEAYTGAFISSRGSRLSDIGVLLASTKFDYEEWVSVRFGVGMPWKRCYAVVTQKYGKKKDTVGEINFYENDKKIKKQHSMTTVSHARAVYAVYPSSPKLIDNSTMIKLEGTVKFKDEESTHETSLFMMPERHDAVPCYDTIIRFILPVMNAFKLYGRPKKLIANKDDPMSLLFALPTLPHIYYLQVDDLLPLTSSLSSSHWSALEWKEKIRDILQSKLNKGYSGCGSSKSLKDILASPLLESGELFQTSGNILSPLLRSTSGGAGIMSPRLAANNGSKVFQRNASGLKSTTTLSSSISKSPESPLDLDATPKLPQVPLDINQPNVNSTTSPYNSRSKMSDNNPTSMTGYNGSPKKGIPNKTNVSSGSSGTGMMDASGGPIPVVNMPPVDRDKWTQGNRRPSREVQGRAPLDQLDEFNNKPVYNERYDNFLNPNARRDNDPSPRKQKPVPLDLQSSNFDKVNEQGKLKAKASPNKSMHSRAESSFSFLIDAYSELEDNKEYGDENKGLDISLKKLNLTNDSDHNSQHDVFDPDFVEQNQMLEMENRYGSMTSQSKKMVTNSSPGRDQDAKLRQEKEVLNIKLPKNNYERGLSNPHLTAEQPSHNGKVQSPQDSTLGKKAPPPPPPVFQSHGQQSPHQQPQGHHPPHQQPQRQQPPNKQPQGQQLHIQQPQGQQLYSQQPRQPHPHQQPRQEQAEAHRQLGPHSHHHHHNHQPPVQNVSRPPPQQVYSPTSNQNNVTPTTNNFSIPNPYSKGPTGSSPQPQSVQIPQNNVNDKSNMQPPSMGYPNQQRNTPPYQQSPVFNNNAPQFNNPYQHPPPPQQYNSHHHPQVQQQQIQTKSNRMVPPGQNQGQFAPRAPYHNNGNYTQNQSPPPNRPFPGTLPRGNNNNMNNVSPQQQQQVNPQMYQQMRGPNNNNNPPYPNNGRPTPQAHVVHQQPLRPQPPSQPMTGSPQQRGFNRPKPGGFSQFMPPSSSTNGGTNPYA